MTKRSSARRLSPIELVKGGDVPAQLARDYLQHLRANGETWTHGLNGTFGNKKGWTIAVQVDLGRGQIHIWAPDKLQTAVPQLPLPEYLDAVLTRCTYCLGPAIKQHRLGFVGRACTHCHTALLSSVEKPGWAN